MGSEQYADYIEKYENALDDLAVERNFSADEEIAFKKSAELRKFMVDFAYNYLLNLYRPRSLRVGKIRYSTQLPPVTLNDIVLNLGSIRHDEESPQMQALYADLMNQIHSYKNAYGF